METFTAVTQLPYLPRFPFEAYLKRHAQSVDAIVTLSGHPIPDQRSLQDLCPPLKNLLASEKSPYLLQHADNPVHWMPWGDAAFEEARRRGLPVFVSIGYSTCHWCHVMAEESFSDPEVAEILNREFVSVKVDREERPDVDAACMSVCQLMNGHGGWPLTLVTTPDREPFFAGTYIPKYSRGNERPGLLDLLPLIAKTWVEQPDHIRSIVGSVREGVERLNKIGDSPSAAEFSEGHTTPQSPTQSPHLWDPQPHPGRAETTSNVERCARHLLASQDEQFGGFGASPKFPTPHNLLFLLDYGVRDRKSDALDTVRRTLKRMRYGGIYDQIASGFHRYAVDRAWKIPHFEKMLVDQAFLLLAYARCGAWLGHNLSQRTARELAGFITREMTSAEGLFHTAIDADSEGEEGVFYTWSLDEIHRSLTLTESALIEEIYHLRPEGNYLEERTGYPNGRNILYLTDDITDHARRLGMDEGHFQELLDELRGKLLEIRSRRTRPATDDKILTDWNALMIHALVKAGTWLDEPAWVETARSAWRVLLDRVMVDGRLHHLYRGGGAAVPGMAMDHVCMSLASLTLFEHGHDPGDLRFSLDMLEQAESMFGDPAHGGLFMNREDSGVPLGRQRDLIDTATPSLNSLYGWLLYRLHRLTGRSEFNERFAQCLDLVGRWSGSAEKIAPFLLRTQVLNASTTVDVVICGRTDDPSLHQMAEVAASFVKLEPCVLVLHEENAQELHELCPFTRGMHPSEQAWAALCTDHACQRPVHEAGELYALLRQITPGQGLLR